MRCGRLREHAGRAARRRRPAGCRCCPATARAVCAIRGIAPATAAIGRLSHGVGRITLPCDGDPAAARARVRRRRSRGSPARRRRSARAAAQRFWPDRDPIGQHFQINVPGPDITVVGMVGDVHSASLDEATQPTIYVPYRQDAFPFMTFVAEEPPLGASALHERRARRHVDGGQASAGRRAADDGRAAVELAVAAPLQRHAAERRSVRPRSRWPRLVSTACSRSSSRAAPPRDRRPHRARCDSRATSSPMSSATVCVSPALDDRRPRAGARGHAADVVAAVRNLSDRCRHLLAGARRCFSRDRRSSRASRPALRAEPGRSARRAARRMIAVVAAGAWRRAPGSPSFGRPSFRPPDSHYGFSRSLPGVLFDVALRPRRFAGNRSP